MARFRGGISSGDKTLADSARQAVQAQSARRLAAAVKSGDCGAIHVEHLASRVDAQTRAGVVDDRRRPGGKERRRFDFVARLWLTELCVHAGFDKSVVAGDGLPKGSRRHW